MLLYWHQTWTVRCDFTWCGLTMESRRSSMWTWEYTIGVFFEYVYYFSTPHSIAITPRDKEWVVPCKSHWVDSIRMNVIWVCGVNILLLIQFFWMTSIDILGKIRTNLSASHHCTTQREFDRNNHSVKTHTFGSVPPPSALHTRHSCFLLTLPIKHFTST